LADHAGETRPQGDHIGHIALIAAVVQRQAPLLIDDEGQRKLTEVMPLLLIVAPLGEAGPTVEGMDKGIVVGRIIDQELLPQGEALANPCEQLPLDGGKVVRREQVHMIPEALTAQLLRGCGHQSGEHRPGVPLGEGALTFGPDGAVERREDQVVANRQRGATPCRGWRHVGVDQLDEAQILCQGIKQGRSPKLPGLHGP